MVAMRREAIAVADKPSVKRREAGDWHQRTLVVLEESYGPAAAPAREFSRIRFDDDAIADLAERVLREKAIELGVDLGDQKIGLPPAATAQGLEAAAELLLSLTLRAE